MRKRTLCLEYAVFPLILGIMVCVMTMNSLITLGQGCRFYFYQVFCVLLPGMAFYRLMRVPGTDVIEGVFCGYALGYVVVIIEYLIFAIFAVLEYLVFFQVFTAVGSLFVLFRSVNAEEELLMGRSKVGNRQEWLLLIIFFFFVFAIRYVTYFGRNMLPAGERNVVFPTQDILFYIGNAISAKRGLPLEDLRFAGQFFKYHYFGSAQLAVTSLVTGIDALELEVCFGWLQPVILVVSGFYLLLRRLEVKWHFCILGMVMFLFTAGHETLVYVSYQSIMYSFPFGYDFGLAMGIFVILFLYIQHTIQKLWGGILAGVIAFFFACEGSKAPIAVILLFLAGCVCCVWLLTPKRRMWAFVYGIPLVMVFVVIFFGVVSEGFTTITTNVTGLKFDLTGRLHLYESGLGKMYFEWTTQGMPQAVGKILILGMYYFGCNVVAYALLLVLSGKHFLNKRSRLLSFEGAMLIAVYFGLLMTLITKQQGNSQMYFAMFSFPLAVALSMRLWTVQTGSMGKWVKRLLYGCFSIVLLYSVVCFLQVITPFWREGAVRLEGEDIFEQKNNSLTYDEWLAYKWVKDNTEKDAICVTNVVMDNQQYESFVVGVCTERQMFMEGWRYVAGYVDEEVIQQRRSMVRAFFEGAKEAEREIKSAGVNYVIWIKRYSDARVKETTTVWNKVFENNAVAVYAIE